jgi:capsular polysaccharide biosynthesis protein
MNTRLHPTLALVARYWIVVLVAAILGGLVAFGVSRLSPQVYNATATLYFSITYGASGSDLNQGATYAQSQMLSFAELARSAQVLDPVANALDLDLSSTTLASMIDASTPENTVVIDLTASSSDPELAVALANETARSLTDAVRQVAPTDEDDRSTVTVRTVETATLPTSPSAPNTRVNVIAGVLLGLLAAVLYIVLRRQFDTRIRTTDDVEAATGIPVLASVDTTGEGAAEGYRRLRATLEGSGLFAPRRGAKTRAATSIAVVSATADEGAMELAIALAHALVESGRSVTFAATDDATAGEPVDTLADWMSPPTIVTTPALEAALQSVAGSADVVVFAAPDLVGSSSALTIGATADHTILAVGAGRVHEAELADTMRQLASAGIVPVGTVLTHRPRVRVGRTFRRGVSAPNLAVLEHNNA